MRTSRLKLHDFRSRLYALLACLVVSTTVLGLTEWFGYAKLRELDAAARDGRKWQDMTWNLQRNLSDVHGGLLRLLLARSRRDVVEEGRRLDQVFYRIQNILTVLHRGEQVRSNGEAVFVVSPLPEELRSMASGLVGLCRDVADDNLDLLHWLLEESTDVGSDGLQDRLRQEMKTVELAGHRADELVQALRQFVTAADARREEQIGGLWTSFLIQGGLTAALMLLFALAGLRAGRRLESALELSAAAVTEANAGMERILEALPVGIAILDGQRMIRRVNLAATNLLCIEPGWQFSQHVRWDVFCERQEAGMTEQTLRPDFEHEVRLQALDGRVLDVIKSSVPVNLQGETLQLEVFMDVTRRRQAERDVLQEKARLESLLAGIDQGVALADVNGIIREVNDRLCLILDCPAVTRLCEHVWDLFPGGVLAAELSDCFQALRNNPESWPGDLHVDAFRDMALVVRVQPVVREGDFDGMIVSIVEVTEIVEARKRAEAASQAKSMFLANMSHEIRTPMNVIVGNAELLSRMGLNADQREAADSIRQCAESLLVIVNDILDFSKIEAGMMRVATAEVSLPEMLEGVQAFFQDEARRKGLELRLVTENLAGLVRTDPGRLRQVLVNLVGNAVKFTARGHVEVLVRGEGETGRRAFSFSVSDTGVGIPEDRQRMIFSSFMQADGSLTREYGGTGLGLTIADSLVRLLGGTGIRVRSQPGRGSSFSFTLMMDIVSRRSVAAPEHGASATAPGFSHVRVLAVEDNAFNRSLLQKMFGQLGVSDVTMAVNGQDALDRLAEKDFSIIFMDIQMPVMDGLTATRALRDRGLSIPVVALTAHALESDQVRCMDAGMNAHLAKPYNLGELSDILNTWCV